MAVAIASPSPSFEVLQFANTKHQNLDVFPHRMTNLLGESRLQETLEIMEQRAYPLSRDCAYRLLQECARKEDVKCGRQLEFLIIRHGMGSVSVLGDYLIRLFSTSGGLFEAIQAFERILLPSVFSWSAIFSAYFAHVTVAHLYTAFELYHAIELLDIKVDKYVYLAVMKICTRALSLEHGKVVHSRIIQSCLQSDSILAVAVIDNYARCGCLEEAERIFETLPNRDVVSWNVLIAGYARHGNLVLAIKCIDDMHKSAIRPDVISWSTIIAGYVMHNEGFLALQCYRKMQDERINPNKVTFLSIVKACSSLGCISQGRLIHDQIIKSRFQSDPIMESTLIDMYFKCGSMEDAHNVFNNLSNQNVLSWTSMISAYVEGHENLLAVECFNKMQENGISPESITFLSIIKACSSLGSLEQGRLIHNQIIGRDIYSDVLVGSSMIDMYSKCGSLEEACGVFGQIKYNDNVSFNAMLSGYVQSGKWFHALECFKAMQEEVIMPNETTFSSILKVCGSIGGLEQGRLIHNHILSSFCWNDITGSSLVDMYAKCGSLEEAYNVFVQLPSKDVISWSAMIAGYANNGEGFSAFACFAKMQEEGIYPSDITFLGLIKVCIAVKSIERGRMIHEELIRCSFLSKNVICNNLINMYAKCGSLEEACYVFNKLPNQDVISWGAMIEGYVHHGDDIHALECFKEMQNQGIQPNAITFLSALKACGKLGAKDQGMLISEQIKKMGFQDDIFVGSTLVDMYAKFGSLEDAWNVFNKLPLRNVVSWNALISGYAQHGDRFLALKAFEEMQHDNVLPERATFLSILKVCGSTGALEHGRHIHLQIVSNGLFDDPIIGSAIIDMFAKCGSLREAHNVFANLTSQDVISWNTMIAGYAQHGIAELAVQCLNSMEQDDIRPDQATYIGILIACSRAGLLDEGHWYFKYMTGTHGITPDMFHYNCLIDLSSRAGYLEEAVSILQATFEPNICGLMSLLSACWLHGNVALARRCFCKVINIDPSYAAAYVLMANICGDAERYKTHTAGHG